MLYSPCTALPNGPGMENEAPYIWMSSGYSMRKAEDWVLAVPSVREMAESSGRRL